MAAGVQRSPDCKTASPREASKLQAEKALSVGNPHNHRSRDQLVRIYPQVNNRVRAIPNTYT